MRSALVTLCLVLLGGFPLVAADELSGRRAPGFALPDSTMKYHDLADYRGKVVLLDIMQTRCPSCQTLAQTLERVKKTYGDKVAILTVVTPPDNQKTVAEFLAKFQLTTPILFDCGQMVGSYLLPNPQRPSIHVPHLFLIDRRGIIRKHFDHTSLSIFAGKGLNEHIDRLLADKPAGPE